MAVNFPTSPSNGQTITANGITYAYDSGQGVWSDNPVSAIDGIVIGGSTAAAGTFTTLTSNGILAGTTSTQGGHILSVKGDGTATAVFRRDSDDGAVLNCMRGTSFVGSITVASSSTAFNTSSDQRLKENIVDAPAGNIDDICVRSFDWKVDGSHQTYGMVAQELVDVAPEAVTQGDSENDMWAVDYSKLVPMIIKEIQDLKAEVAALKGE